MTNKQLIGRAVVCSLLAVASCSPRLAPAPVVPHKAGLGGSGSSGADWADAMKAVFATKTGLAAYDWAVIASDEFYSFGNGGNVGISGTGSTLGWANGPGVVRLVGPTAGNSGSAYYKTNIAGGNPMITDFRTKRWMVAYRGAVISGASDGNEISLGVFGYTTYWGFGAEGTDSNWHYQRSGSDVSDLSYPITAGQYVTAYMGNFNLTDLSINMTPELGSADVTIAGEIANLPSGATGQPYAIVDNATGSQTAQGEVDLDAVIWMVER